jgi:hypothetical protein
MLNRAKRHWRMQWRSANVAWFDIALMKVFSAGLCIGVQVIALQLYMMLQKMGLTIYDIAGAGLLALSDDFGVADCYTTCGRKPQN